MQNKLEEAAIAARQQLITSNSFNNFANENNYSATHTKAMSDEETPIHGKGTGINFDTYNGGGYNDIYGVANAAGSGRIANLATNQFSPNNEYGIPDMSGNIGQVTIE